VYELDKRDMVLIGLVGLFTASIVSAQITASKLIAVDVPLLGMVALPAAVFAYSISFFVTDLTGEMYGRKTAAAVVWTGFLMNFVLLALVWLAILWPGSGQGVPADQFASVLGASTPIVIASLTAYLLSQNYDVFVFHKIRSWTGSDYLWIRNVFSTATSQFVDSAVFLGTAFFLLPVVFGMGMQLPNDVLVTTLVGYWVVKVGIAVADTPLVYAGVFLLERFGFERAALQRDDTSQALAD